MPDFMNKYPDIKLEWHLSNKQVNLITDNFDAAIGSGFKLGQGIIKRSLSSSHDYCRFTKFLKIKFYLVIQMIYLTGMES